MGKNFQCPVCRAKTNNSGKPFSSERAVALHIAGKIKGQCNDHKIWAFENCGQTEINQALTKARETQGINILADLMLLPVKAWNDENSKGNIGFKNR